ncbi:MAG: hypothetical protein V9G19_22740 [Tetrasphaera sp.]
MSHPPISSTDPRHARVRSYVAQVRAELSDLPPEEVEDLTLGMEADLSELAAESGLDVRSRLGTPQTYAAELRAAAGLPPRSAATGRGLRLLSSVRERAEGAGARVLAALPWLRELCGAWWVVRGLIVGAGVAAFFAFSSVGLGVLITIAAVAASIWLGLRSRGARWWLPVALLNVALVLALPLWLIGVATWDANGETDWSPVIEYRTPETGIYAGGHGVANIYAYDAEGRRLDGVRLFDQDGTPLTISGDQVGELIAPPGTADDSSLWQANGEPRLADTFPASWFGRRAWDALAGWTPPLTIVPTDPSAAWGSASQPPAAPGVTQSASPTATDSATSASKSASSPNSGSATASSTSRPRSGSSTR